MLKGKGDYNAVKEIIAAYTVVMELAGEYFKVPEVVKESEAKETEGQGDNDEKPKNA